MPSKNKIRDDANVTLNGFGFMVNDLGQRVKSYLPQICHTIKRRLNRKRVNLDNDIFYFQNCCCEVMPRGETNGSLRCCASCVLWKRIS